MRPEADQGIFLFLFYAQMLMSATSTSGVESRASHCCANEAFGTFLRYRLQADPATVREADLLVLGREILLEEREEFRIRFRAALEFDARVDVFGILTEDHHVDTGRIAHGRRYAGEPAHRAQADIKIQQLA